MDFVPGLILLHRNFFVQAIIENPEDPARSRFGPSFLSAYRSAVAILRSMRGVLNRRPQIISRVWPFWAHALSAAVLLGSISACATTSSLAPQAFEEFNDAISMLEKSQLHPLLKDMMVRLHSLFFVFDYRSCMIYDPLSADRTDVARSSLRSPNPKRFQRVGSSSLTSGPSPFGRHHE